MYSLQNKITINSNNWSFIYKAIWFLDRFYSLITLELQHFWFMLISDTRELLFLEVVCLCLVTQRELSGRGTYWRFNDFSDVRVENDEVRESTPAFPIPLSLRSEAGTGGKICTYFGKSSYTTYACTKDPDVLETAWLLLCLIVRFSVIIVEAQAAKAEIKRAGAAQVFFRISIVSFG